MDRSERTYITRCKRLIEEKLQFGNEQGEVRQRDLEYLADCIEEKSGISLSLSTLKRLWKSDYDKMPHPSTLQALVSVLGYKDWQTFKLREAEAPEAAAVANMPEAKETQGASEGTDVPERSASPAAAIVPKTTELPEAIETPKIAKEVQEDIQVPKAPSVPKPAKKHTYTIRFNPWLLLPLVAAVAVGCWLIAFRKGPPNKKPVINGAVTFTGNKTVSQGVPNTIIFNYDVTNVDADSFYLQQSWNPLEKVKLDPNNHVYSSIYYFPGFHRAKLIANDSIIKRFRVHITTDGWLPLTRYSLTDGNPIYLQKENMVRNGSLHLTRDDLVAASVNMEKKVILSYYNIREFDNTQSDHFSIDTRIRCDSLQTVACPGFELVIVCEEHIYFVRMMGKGCERDIAVKVGEVVHDGIHKDLSVFGRNLYQWQHLQIKIVDKKATIYLDEQPVYSIPYKKDFGRVVGLSYNFSGAGAVDYVRLMNGDNRVVYADEFNE
jgi:hypothetical protein